MRGVVRSPAGAVAGPGLPLSVRPPPPPTALADRTVVEPPRPGTPDLVAQIGCGVEAPGASALPAVSYRRRGWVVSQAAKGSTQRFCL